MNKESRCAFCGSANLTDVIDFGKVAIAGGFLAKEEIPFEKKHDLVIVFCDDCYAVQVRDHIDPSVLFEKDFYFSSAIKTLRDHFAGYAKEVVERFIDEPEHAVTVEFGSNDGVLLEPLASQGVGKVIGVDPAKNIISSVKNDALTLINDFFTVSVAKNITQNYGKANLVMANNVFAHITDINGATEAVREVLAEDGVFIFEVHYLGKIIEEMQYDFMYHEHTYYYSLLALENHFARHGMVIFDLKPIPIHGGSIRYYAAKKGSKHATIVTPAVEDLRREELQRGYDKSETYQKFAANVAEKKRKLMELMAELKSSGMSIVGYGASGRGNTILQYCGITTDHIEFIIDDGPAKQGLYTPGSHIEIRSREALKTYKPDYILLFAWAFYEEIAAKLQDYFADGGKMIVPLPNVIVIDRSGTTQR